MHIVYRQYLQDPTPKGKKIMGVITSNNKAIKYVNAKNVEEKANGGWYEWSSEIIKAIIV